MAALMCLAGGAAEGCSGAGALLTNRANAGSARGSDAWSVQADSVGGFS